MPIPVYVFTGFLDAGKTKFIQETLEDPRFNAGERTLLLVFEEGEEEYDLSAFPKKNVYLEVLDQDAVTPRQLAAMQKKYRAERVVAELNGMKLVGDLYTRFLGRGPGGDVCRRFHDPAIQCQYAQPGGGQAIRL